MTDLDLRLVPLLDGTRDRPELTDRLTELPDATLWVHCASGFRASIAASLLDRAGHHVVYIDDEYSAAQDLGLAPR